MIFESGARFTRIDEPESLDEADERVRYQLKMQLLRAIEDYIENLELQVTRRKRYGQVYGKLELR